MQKKFICVLFFIGFLLSFTSLNFIIPALAQEDGGTFGFMGDREALGSDDPQNPNEGELMLESDSLIKSSVLDVQINEKEQRAYAFIYTYEKDGWKFKARDGNEYQIDHAQSIWIIDTSNDNFEVISKSVEGPYHALTIDKSKNKSFVRNTFTNFIEVFDGTTNEKIDSIDVGEIDGSQTVMALDESTNRLYLIDRAFSIFVIDTDALELVKKIEVKGRPNGIAVNEKLHYAYVPKTPFGFDEKNTVEDSEFLVIDKNGDIVEKINLVGGSFNVYFPVDSERGRIYLPNYEGQFYVIGESNGKHSIIQTETYDSRDDFWSSERAVLSNSQNALYFTTAKTCSVFKMDTKDNQNTVFEREFLSNYGRCEDMYKKYELMALDDSKDRLYVKTGNLLSIFDVEVMFEQPEPEPVPEPITETILKSISFFNFGLKEGQWAKYQITNIDVQGKGLGPFSPEGLEQVLIESLIPTDEYGNYLSSEWYKLTVEDISNSEYTVGVSVGLTSGEEKNLRSRTHAYALENSLPQFIPTTLKDGDQISIGDFIFDVEDSQLTVGGKKLDALKLLFEEKKTDIGIVTDVRIENWYHKQTGMFLLTDTEIHAIGGAGSLDMIFGIHAIEVSDHFLEKPALDIGGGGCLIATATFGTELAPQIQQLRELRDNSLLQTQSGQSFMNGFNQFYYLFSPTIADWERQNPVFKEAVKLTITPLLTSLSILNYVDVDSESEVLGYGISLILLNIGMYFVLPAFIVHRIRKFVLP